MKILALLLILIAPLQAQIFADIQTTAGNFTVELYHEKSPKAVANFLGLATGSRPWIDSTTGKVRTDPFYNGITFHRVIEGFVNQFGSKNGLGTDGPGYTFRDEFDPSLDFSTPYLLAMANSGPQSNGSQLFTTVGTPTNLNNVHTILGIIPNDGTSRQTIDAINTAPKSPGNSSTLATPITITSVTIRRVGTSAQNFDINAQDLPNVTAPPATITKSPLTHNATKANGSVFTIQESTDLLAWSPLTTTYLDQDDSLTTQTDLTTTSSGEPKKFFHHALATYTNTPPYLPSTYLDRTLTIESTIGSTAYTFTSDTGGTLVHTNANGSTVNAAFATQISNQTPHSLNIFIFTNLQNGSGELIRFRLTLGLDAASATNINGRHSGTSLFFDPQTSTTRNLNSERATFTLTLPSSP